MTLLPLLPSLLALLLAASLLIAIAANRRAQRAHTALADATAAHQTACQQWYARGYEEATQIVNDRHAREAERAYQKGRRDGAAMVLDELAAADAQALGLVARAA